MRCRIKVSLCNNARYHYVIMHLLLLFRYYIMEIVDNFFIKFKNQPIKSANKLIFQEGFLFFDKIVVSINDLISNNVNIFNINEDDITCKI